MAYRTIADRHGVVWEVWAVTPMMVERREGDTGAFPVPDGNTSAFPVTSERPRKAPGRPSLPLDFRKGWLSFRSSAQRRRLAPLPLGWEAGSNEELLDLLESAELVGDRSTSEY